MDDLIKFEQNERLFSESEEEQLMNVFGLTKENLGLVLDSCCYIFEQVRPLKYLWDCNNSE
jgi:hypothetical protein